MVVVPLGRECARDCRAGSTDLVYSPSWNDEEEGEAQVDQMALIASDSIWGSNHISSCLPILTF